MLDPILVECLERLPLLGKIKSLYNGRACVEDSGNNHCLKQEERLSSPNAGDPDLLHKQILYSVGRRQGKTREEVMEWAVIDELAWPDDNKPLTQRDLDSLRRAWLEQLNAPELLKIISSASDSKANVTAINRYDPILQNVALTKLAELGASDWKALGIKKMLTSSHYKFLNELSWENESFSAEQLATLGPPNSGLTKSLNHENRLKLLEWACRSSLSAGGVQDWEMVLSQDINWAAQVAAKLLQSDWDPTPLGIRLISRLAKERIRIESAIEQRIAKNPNEWEQWLGFLSCERQFELLAAHSQSMAELIANCVSSFNSKKLAYIALQENVISIDIESDGDEIWELGTATRKQTTRVLKTRQDEFSKESSVMQELAEVIRKKIVVIGHNMLAWDWPTLEPRLPDGLEVLIWDTQLVSFMLEPWKVSHALGSSHQADEDAQAAFDLFTTQLDQIGGDIALRLLTKEISSTAALMRALAFHLHYADWCSPSLPIMFEGVANDPSQMLVVDRQWLKRLAWVPRVGVVSADERDLLGINDQTISEELFTKSLRTDQHDDPFAIAVAYVLNKAKAADIAVRVSMLPLWWRKREKLEQAVNSAATTKKFDTPWLTVAEYPHQASWFAKTDLQACTFLDPPMGSFLAKKTLTSSREIVGKIPTKFDIGVEPPRSGSHYRFKIGTEPEVNLWISLDPAAYKLEAAGRFFRCLESIDTRNGAQPAILRSTTKVKNKPQLLIRNDISLYPGSDDQAAYWRDVISAMDSIASNQPPDVVSILLISSTSSKELINLLEQCLYSLSLATPYRDFHSFRERLRHAARLPNGCIVDRIEAWEEWQAFAVDTGIQVVAVIECLPIPEWYTTSRFAEAEADPSQYQVNATDESEQESEIGDPSNEDTLDEGQDNPFIRPNLVSSAEMAQHAHELCLDNLEQWLSSLNLSDSERSCILIDSRLSAKHTEIRKLCDSKEYPDKEWTAEQSAAIALVLEPLEISRAIPSSDYETLRLFLERYWNVGKAPGDPSWIEGFRDHTQRPAIEAIRDRRRDVLVTLPTGEGKSVLFQVPALYRGLKSRRLSIVISPLRALMRDQVTGLGRLGFHQSVDYLSSDRSFYESEDVLQGILDHRIVLLYVAPERFRSKRFIDVLDRRFISDNKFEYVIFDEAHCISQWGYDFRPDYFYALSTICRKYRNPAIADKTPILLLSATITAANERDLVRLTKGDPLDASDRYLPWCNPLVRYSKQPIGEFISIQPMRTLGKIHSSPKADWPVEDRLKIITDLIDQARLNALQTGQTSSGIVFVSRRDHAEELSSRIGSETSVSVDYFHAGLDSDTREDVYKGFRDCDIQVLVATKAFGMGMDIRHIHWAVHLSPPTFLEDYLQEVGRIGRGKFERENAKLESLTACLLFSADDFEANRTFLQKSRIDFRQISDFYDQILSHCRMTDLGILISMVPDAGFTAFSTSSQRRAACTQTRKMLFWLERLGKSEIVSMIPGLLPVRLNLSKLSQIANTANGKVAKVSHSLLSIAGEAPPLYHPTDPIDPAPSNEEKKSILKHMIQKLSDFVGMLVASSATPRLTSEVEDRAPASSTSLPLQQNVEAIINLGQLWHEACLDDIDEALEVVVKLQNSGALEIKREISFSSRYASQASKEEIEQLFVNLTEVTFMVLRRLEHESPQILDFDRILEDLASTTLTLEAANRLHGSADARLAFERSVCFLLRSSGVRIRGSLPKGQRELSATLVQSQIYQVRARINATLISARNLWQEFASSLSCNIQMIEIPKLLRAICGHASSQRFHERDLRRALSLLSAMRLVVVSEPLVPLSYVLLLQDSERIKDQHDHSDVWSELLDVNRLTELRCTAFEIFANLPSEMSRKEFIGGYFKQGDAVELETFLNQQLLCLDDSTSSEFIQQKRDQIQASAIDEYLSKYRRNSIQPNQWLAITHPFDRNLLVNAGPGAGKTSVLIARIAHLIHFQHIRPEQILVLAFNRAVVSEIRQRIRDLFGRLGYGSYVRRLNVSTFHAFAQRHLRSRNRAPINTKVADPLDTDQDVSVSDDTRNFHSRRIKVDPLLKEFADCLEQDNSFASTISGDLRALMVDEFQDLNDDIYRIVHTLARSCSRKAGVMVIGDDDQDILDWNRVHGNSSITYFERFKSDNPESHDLALAINYRSQFSLVRHTDGFLNDFAKSAGTSFKRLKNTPLTAHRLDDSASVERINASFNCALDSLACKFDGLSNELNPSIAILCRTNNEVAQAYDRLHDCLHDLAFLRTQNCYISSLRHIGLWLDEIKANIQRHGDRPLSDALCLEFNAFYQDLEIPEVKAPRSEDIDPTTLWNLCCRETSYPYLSGLVDFVESLKIDDYDRLKLRDMSPSGLQVVSTIHKVKGLEFDRVIMLPSSSRFGSQDPRSLRQCSAAEARLFYVGMTRARDSLQYFWGPREIAWSATQEYKGEAGTQMLLQGIGKEVGLSWASERTRYNPYPEQTLAYINKFVRVGDPLELGPRNGRSVLHRGQDGRHIQIGYLAYGIAGGDCSSQLRVSNVRRIRYKGKSYYDGQAAESVLRAGWSLCVMVEGTLAPLTHFKP